MSFFQDLRFGIRMLIKDPGFTAVVIVTLALGIGVNTTVFTLVNAVLFKGLPFEEPDRIMFVASNNPSKGRDRMGVSYPDYVYFRDHTRKFQSLTAFTGSAATVSDFSGLPDRHNGARVSANCFSLIGQKPLLGRDFMAAEDRPGAPPVALLGYSVWKNRFGGDPTILGKALRINEVSTVIVGVMPQGMQFPFNTDVWLPLIPDANLEKRDNRGLQVCGRLVPHATQAEAQTEMGVLAKNLEKEYSAANQGVGAAVRTASEQFNGGPIRTIFLALMGAVGFVLLIACANVANLLLARGISRTKEVAVRTSLGATRANIFSQFLVESLIMAGLGGIVGIGLGELMLKILMAKIPFELPSEADVRLSLPVLLFTLAATTLAGIFFGCAPAWQASRVNPNETLKEGGRTGTSTGKHRLRRILVVAEFALALTLLTAAGLAMHSFWNVTRIDLGIRKDHILTFFLPVSQERFTKADEISSYYRQMLEKTRAVPGVVDAAASTGTPLQGTFGGMYFSVSGKPVADPSLRPTSPFQMVTPGYFATYGVRIVKGRSFTDQDSEGSARVAMVNENFVRRYLPGVDPLTQIVSVDQLIPGAAKTGDIVPWQIVGVFHNVRNGRIREDDIPEIDVPFWQSPWPQAAMAVRTQGEPGALSKSIAAAIHSVDPNLPLANIKTMDQIFDESLLGDQFVAALFGCFAGTALLLAALGIYGVMAFGVAQRTHEIGLRIALGAGKEQVLRLILREGLLLASAGLGIGLLGAYFLGRAMQSTLYGVGTIDFGAFCAVAMVLLASSLLACYLPARRATRIDPIVALRYE